VGTEDIPALNELSRINALNSNILNLRKIHGFYYYCLKGFKDEKNLTKRCDYLHLRH
jgi:hypothetical protein